MMVGATRRRSTRRRGKVCAEADEAIRATARTITIFFKQADPSVVLAGLVPAIHVFFTVNPKKTWMPATSAGHDEKRSDRGITCKPPIRPCPAVRLCL